MQYRHQVVALRPPELISLEFVRQLRPPIEWDGVLLALLAAALVFEDVAVPDVLRKHPVLGVGEARHS